MDSIWDGAEVKDAQLRLAHGSLEDAIAPPHIMRRSGSARSMAAVTPVVDEEAPLEDEEPNQVELFKV